MSKTKTKTTTRPNCIGCLYGRSADDCSGGRYGLHVPEGYEMVLGFEILDSSPDWHTVKLRRAGETIVAKV